MAPRAVLWRRPLRFGGFAAAEIRCRGGARPARGKYPGTLGDGASAPLLSRPLRDLERSRERERDKSRDRGGICRFKYGGKTAPTLFSPSLWRDPSLCPRGGNAAQLGPAPRRTVPRCAIHFSLVTRSRCFQSPMWKRSRVGTYSRARILVAFQHTLRSIVQTPQGPIPPTLWGRNSLENPKSRPVVARWRARGFRARTRRARLCWRPCVPQDARRSLPARTTPTKRERARAKRLASAKSAALFPQIEARARARERDGSVCA